ncbi:hypothetical protein HanPI659440_Chr15g0598271 [Helianthus annuus]|nr:hypothetical protein HanPI659440_Chr15g0598271 [Helianthus annuus]
MPQGCSSLGGIWEGCCCCCLWLRVATGPIRGHKGLLLGLVGCNFDWCLRVVFLSDCCC